MKIEMNQESKHPLIDFEIAFASRDQYRMSRFLHNNVIWLIRGVGRYHGGEVLEHLAMFHHHRIETLIIESVVVNQKRVVISGIYVDECNQRLSFANMYQYEDGVVSRMTSYFINVL